MARCQEAQRRAKKKYRDKSKDKMRAYQKAYYSLNKERVAVRIAKYVAENKERVRAIQAKSRARHSAKNNLRIAAWAKANPERMRGYSAKHNNANRASRNRAGRERYSFLTAEEKMKWQRGNRERVRAIKAKHRKLHPEKGNAYSAQRKAAKLRAVPKWANEFFIEEAYRLSALRTKMFGYPWHVDHIVPLQSKLVCGLHTHHNLQVIPGRLNNSKHNKWWPDMPREEGVCLAA